MTADRSNAREEPIVALGRTTGDAPRLTLRSSPLLAALRKAGTLHIYGDTVDSDELLAKISCDGEVLEEVDGSTSNQPLVQKVLAHYLEGDGPRRWSQALTDGIPGLAEPERTELLYMVVCGRASTDMARRLSQGRAWQVSIQLHMRLASDVERGARIGHLVRRMVPTAFVKVPFLPHAPQSILLARELERTGVPVNLTSTFSARQAVVVAMLADVSRTNIFMGRINQGLEAELLGEHVDLEAQRHIRRLRADLAVRTQLIIASVRDWRTFAYTAGCDAYTAPLAALDDFLKQTEIGPEAVTSQLATSYEDRLGIAPRVLDALGAERVARLWRVEPELIEFLSDYRRSAEYAGLSDGDALYKRFDEAGFADLFHCPSASEWAEIQKDKLPKLDSPLTKRLPIDTLFTLLADADFDKYQEANDAAIRKAIGAA